MRRRPLRIILNVLIEIPTSGATHIVKRRVEGILDYLLVKLISLLRGERYRIAICVTVIRGSIAISDVYFARANWLKGNCGPESYPDWAGSCVNPDFPMWSASSPIFLHVRSSWVDEGHWILQGVLVQVFVPPYSPCGS